MCEVIKQKKGLKGENTHLNEHKIIKRSSRKRSRKK